MSRAKSQAGVPKGWPGTTVYLHAPRYSTKLSKEKKDALLSAKSDLPADTQALKANGPYQNVKIQPISNPSHPANGQHGLFANQHLPPDTFILPYLGFVHDQEETDETSDYDLSLDREHFIAVDASKMGNEARFLNDYRGVSTAQNAEFRDCYILSANGKVEKTIGIFVLSAGKNKSAKRAKGISRGDEILISYGKGFWTERQTTED
jgi:hypothetical protein